MCNIAVESSEYYPYYYLLLGGGGTPRYRRLEPSGPFPVSGGVAFGRELDHLPRSSAGPTIYVTFFQEPAKRRV